MAGKNSQNSFSSAWRAYRLSTSSNANSTWSLTFCLYSTCRTIESVLTSCHPSPRLWFDFHLKRSISWERNGRRTRLPSSFVISPSWSLQKRTILPTDHAAWEWFHGESAWSLCLVEEGRLCIRDLPGDGEYSARVSLSGWDRWCPTA